MLSLLWTLHLKRWKLFINGVAGSETLNYFILKDVKLSKIKSSSENS